MAKLFTVGGRLSSLLLMLFIHNSKGSNSCKQEIENGSVVNVTGIIQNILSKTNHNLCRPYTKGNSPLTIYTDLKLVSIGDFREADMQFTAEMYFRQSWQDHRLAFHNLTKNTIPSVTLNGHLSDSLWQPDTFFENEVEGKIHGLTMKNKFMRIRKDGHVLTSTRITLGCSCSMDFRKFPMDKQRCGIFFSSYGYTTKDIIYKWESKQDTRNKDYEIPQFVLEEIRVVNNTVEYNTGTYSSLGIRMSFSRRLGHYLTRVYIPAILIVMLSWLSFYVDRHSAPARVSLGITTVLTMTTLLIGIGQGALPVVSYVKALDWYLFVSYFMVFAAFAEYAVINYRDKSINDNKMEKEEIKQKEEVTKKRVEQNGVVNTAQETKKEEKRDTAFANVLPQEAFEFLDVSASSYSLNKQPGIFERINESLSAPEKIDNLSKTLFPLFYILFNVLYWLYYLVLSY